MTTHRFHFTLSKVFAFIALAMSFTIGMVCNDPGAFIEGLVIAGAVIGTKTITADWISREKVRKNHETKEP